MTQQDGTQEGEEWRPVVGYEGRYEVSNLGRVRGIRAKGSQVHGKILNPGTPEDFYPQVQITATRGGRVKVERVHVLVARAFIGPCPEGMEVNHKDGNKLNPHVGNLEYITHLDNCRHIWTVREYPPTKLKGETHGMHRLTEEQVRRIRLLQGTASSRVVGEQFKMERTTIQKIWNGSLWKHLL